MSPRLRSGVLAAAAMGAVLTLALALRETSPNARESRSGLEASNAPAIASATIAPGDAGALATPPDDALAARLRAAADAAPRARFAAKWGSGPGELGHTRPEEGNPEGPMSVALTGDGMIVLDQVNGRMMKLDANGRLERTIDATPTTQDLAVGKDGSIAALDRLVDKRVAVYDANGRKTAELPLPEERVGEGGQLSGVFVDGKDVYVERDHGVLVHLGTTDGEAADEGKELAGRPTKDGALLVSAVLASARAGRVVVNAVDRRTGALRFARAVAFPSPSREIVLLDSDARGTVYLGVAGGPAPDVAEIACMDPNDGHVIGRIDVQVSAVPEETFRDLAVGADGTIVFALRSDEGVTYGAARCP